MSRWKLGFENQRALQKVQGFLTILGSVSTDTLPPQALEELSRLVKVLKIIEGQLSSLDPELLAFNSWANFTNWLDGVNNSIVQFNQNRNSAHLQNANNSLDEMLRFIRPSGSNYSSEDIRKLAEANSQFTSSIVQELELVRKRAQELKTQLDGLSAAAAEAKNRLGENDKVIQEQKGRLDQSIAGFQKQFSDAQEKRSKDFAESMKKFGDEFALQEREIMKQVNEQATKRKQEYEAFFDTARKQSNDHLNLLQKREDEVNKIFGAIGSTAFAGNFKTTADNDAKAADVWRWIALVLMGAMIAVGGFAFYYSIGHETDWRVFGFRLGTVIVLAVPAIYAANESSKHREREKFNRKVHLELSAIDAYLVLLPEDKRNTIKGSLAEKFFGVPPLKESSDEVTQKDLFGALTTVLNNLTKGK